MSTLEFITPTQQSSVTSAPTSLRDTVKHTVQNYLAHLDGQKVTEFYDMVLSEIEEPLLQAIMQYTGQNQSKAAVYLGLSRGTLRKKLERYGMLICGSSRNIE